MKKYLFLAVLAVVLAGCRIYPPLPCAEVLPCDDEIEIDDPTIASNMMLFVDGVGEITEDQTITLHEGEEQLSGKIQMEVKGYIESADAIRVLVTRSAEGREDELCALGVCAAGNGETEQEFNFRSMDGSNTWFAHYTVPTDGDQKYTVNYKFINYSRVITLTVVYDYLKQD